MLMDSIRKNLKQQICSLLTLDLARNSHSICDLILLLLFPCKRKNGSCSFHCADPIFNFGCAQRILWIQFSSLIRSIRWIHLPKISSGSACWKVAMHQEFPRQWGDQYPPEKCLVISMEFMLKDSLNATAYGFITSNPFSLWIHNHPY